MVHLLGACLVWVAALRVLLAMSERVVAVAAADVLPLLATSGAPERETRAASRQQSD
jgi:hypothetical protein